MYFFKPNLVAFDSLFKWFHFSRNDARIIEFSQLTRVIADLVNGIDMIFAPDLLDDFITSNDNLIVDLFRQHAKTKYDSAIEVR